MVGGLALILAGGFVRYHATEAALQREWELAIVATIMGGTMIALGMAFLFPGTPWAARVQALMIEMSMNWLTRVGISAIACMTVALARAVAV